MVDPSARILDPDQLEEGMIAMFPSGWGKVQSIGRKYFDVRYSGLEHNHVFDRDTLMRHLCYLPHCYYDEKDDCWNIHSPETSFWEGDHVQFDDGLNCFTGMVESVYRSLEGDTVKVRITDKIVTEVPVVLLERI